MVCVQVQVNVEGVRVDGAVKGRVGYGVRVEGRGEREQRGGMGLYKLEPVEQTSLYPMPATNSVTRGGAAATAVLLGAHGACGVCSAGRAGSVNSLRNRGAPMASSVRIHVASQPEGASRPVVKEAAAADSAFVPSSSRQRTTQ